MKRWAICGLMLVMGVAAAKLPPLTDEQKAKAEEGKAKAAEVAKKEVELLTGSQDRVASRYIAEMKKQGKVVVPTPIPAPVATVKPALPAAPAAASAKK